MVSLNDESLEFLSLSARDGVSVGFQRVAANPSEAHWLPRGNRYRRTTKGIKGGNSRLNSELANGSVDLSDLTEYVAVMGPVHSMEGWAYLGRAVHCLARGDPYNAVHLAYYAELRAALSLLASEGIGVFNNTHCVIDEGGRAHLRSPQEENLGTHNWTWLTFRWWATQASAIELFGQVVAPYGVNLSTWLEADERTGVALEQIGTRWLDLWGMDIGRFFSDRDARNAASYWPNTVNPWQQTTAVDSFGFIRSLWLPLEPTTGSRFGELDKHLLRMIIKEAHTAATGGRSSRSLDGSIDELLVDMALGGAEADYWRGFLTGVAEPETLAVIQIASGTSRVSDPKHATEVLSRAELLLRISTGSAALHLQEAELGRPQLDFWVDAVGTSRGLWPPDGEPEQCSTLWEDIQVALDESGDWFESGDSQSQSNFDWWEQRAWDLAKLCECERVALWGLGF